MMPLAHWAITSSGFETMNMGAAMTGSVMDWCSAVTMGWDMGMCLLRVHETACAADRAARADGSRPDRRGVPHSKSNDCLKIGRVLPDAPGGAQAAAA
ncbi:hypothetical protein GCM10009108_11350 [Castellaniella ginsengisoli]|uniref:Uncharacterized protein n=1 Tax=Castellaniella ginsengisoli TaxID=546114 RepID=A0ABN1KV64_9BURK